MDRRVVDPPEVADVGVVSGQPPPPVGNLVCGVCADAPIAAVIVRCPEGSPPVLVDVNRAFGRLMGCEPTDTADLVSQKISGLDELVAVLRVEAVTSVPGAVAVAGTEVPVMLHGARLADEAERLVMVQMTSLAPSTSEVERALRESEKRVQDLVDNVEALIYIKAADGAFLLINRHFEEMFGVSRFDAPKCTNFDFFTPEIAAVYTENDRRVLETGIAMEVEEPGLQGASWLSLKFPLFDVAGKIYAVGGISTDITDRRRAEALVLRAKEEAERANRAKSEFLSRMSHELRTPLNSILGFGQLLQMEPLAKDTRETVDRIVTAGRHLLALINEVLEISRIEATGPLTTTEPIDVCRPLTEAVELVRPLARERGIEIVQDLHGGLYRHVIADRQRLMQVMLNVLSNAIKYNRIDGRVHISFRECDGGHLRLLVRDTGYGISSDDLDKVFVPFERLGADRTATEGTGLGLTLSRSLIEAMGGRIGVAESVKGQGTTFFIDLKLSPSEPEAAPPGQWAGMEWGLSPCAGTVLYIEDNLASLDLVNSLFARIGKVRVIPAVQGQLGIELAARHLPDLILLDLHLPDLDGEEVLRRLREEERTAPIPVIVLSADATRNQMLRLERLGALEYVTKPIDVSSFLKAVRRALGCDPDADVSVLTC